MARQKQKHRKKKAVAAHGEKISQSWVDWVKFVPENDVGVSRIKNSSPSVAKANNEKQDDTTTSSTIDVKIVSWNILAEAYTSPKSHPNLPFKHQNIVFFPKRRRVLLQNILRQLVDLGVDFLCLQEVDLSLVRQTLNELKYKVLETPTTSGGGAGGRVDACGIYFKQDQWELVNHELIRLDDLATLDTTTTKKTDETDENNKEGSGTGTSKSIECNLQGLKQSFLRRNVGLVARFQHRKHSSKRIVIVNMHLFWNPDYEYVKLCQAHYVMMRTKAFCGDDPVILCGDLNSTPTSATYQYLVRGQVNAKRFAPWYRFWSRDNDDEQSQTNDADDNDDKTDDGDTIEKGIAKLNIKDEDPLEIRYLMDYTLNKFTRWLRILGIDAALETEEEEIQRTKRGNLIIFDRCRTEKRTLITTSSKLMVRKDCPPGSYLIQPNRLVSLESCLTHVLLTHGVVLKPRNFLTRCVVCNGNIRDVEDLEKKRQIFASYHAAHLSDDLECFECDKCHQGYWWCDLPTSSASRVKNQATELFETCLRAGVPIEGPLQMFDFVNVQAERSKKTDVPLEQLDVVEWMKQERLSCPIELESSYALRHDKDDSIILGEKIPFSNVTSNFVGLLDYIMFQPRHMKRTSLLHVPSSFKELKQRRGEEGGDGKGSHLLPSDVWPSDHLAVGVQLEMEVPELSDVVAEEEDMSAMFCADLGSPPPAPMIPAPEKQEPHPSRCQCGCVPNVLSLFEMAELRKQARARKHMQAMKQTRA